jgi:hypothetical protein
LRIALIFENQADLESDKLQQKIPLPSARGFFVSDLGFGEICRIYGICFFVCLTRIKRIKEFFEFLGILLIL